MDFFAVWLPEEENHHVYVVRYRTHKERKTAVRQQSSNFREGVKIPKLYDVPAGLSSLPRDIREIPYGQFMAVQWNEPVAVKMGTAEGDSDVKLVYDINCVLVTLRAFEENEPGEYIPKRYRINAR